MLLLSGFDAAIWLWLLEFITGNFPSWLAVLIASVALYFLIRKPRVHSELNLVQLKVGDDDDDEDDGDETTGGPISLALEFTTYSHASRLTASAKVKLNGVSYPMTLQEVKTPTNYGFATVNTFPLLFTGECPKGLQLPSPVFIDVRAHLSDGARARFKMKDSLRKV